MKARVGLVGVLGVVMLALSLVFGPVSACASEPFTLQWPVTGTVSGSYLASHQGVDISAPQGAEVVAAHGGIVVYAGWKDNGGGYVVDIDHGGALTSYNHLSDVTVAAGQSVLGGALIGHVGATGNATGPHLHFGLQTAGQWVNPIPFFSEALPNTSVCA